MFAVGLRADAIEQVPDSESVAAYDQQRRRGGAKLPAVQVDQPPCCASLLQRPPRSGVKARF
jgi:hypothetical protein